MYFPQTKNFNAEQSFSTTFFHVQNCLKIVLCHDLCTNILWRSFAWWLGMHKWCFSEPKLCANRDVLIWSLFSHAWLGSLYNTYRCLIAHLRGLLVMHGGNSFNIRGKDVSTKVMMLKELPPCITSSPQNAKYHVITNATYNRDPVPAKFKHVTNIDTCTLLCCDYIARCGKLCM